MSQPTQTSLSTDLRAARTAQIAGQPPESVQRWLQRYQAAIVRRLPPSQRAQGEERYLGLVLGEMQRTPVLQECLRSPEGELSVRIAIQQMAQLGLEPGPLGHCYLLPFRDNRKGITTCTFILGYRGMIELAWASSKITSISARVVYDGDILDYEYGVNDTLRHIPRAIGAYKDRTLTHAYAVAKYVRGGHDFIVLDAEEVAFYRSKSRAATEAYSPWSQFEAAMWRKTAVRRLAPELPLSPEVSNEFARDEARDLGIDLGEGGGHMPALDDTTSTTTEDKA